MEARADARNNRKGCRVRFVSVHLRWAFSTKYCGSIVPDWEYAVLVFQSWLR
ncbi:hypothetical protein PI125_g24769 [Phytophthora idaei]|nr:hypothetical protein PI125_g24769 [Phytophthora idaei]